MSASVVIPSGIIIGSQFQSRVALRVVSGDIARQQTDAIVNAWNRNIIPWWLLIPQGVSGAIKRAAGVAPFRELRRAGPLPLGAAFATSSGRLPHKAIIHVAGIDMLWRASERSVLDSAHNACTLALSMGLRSMALPMIGAGSGGLSASAVEDLLLSVFRPLESETPDLDVTLVRFAKS